MQRENILYYIQRIQRDEITRIELREFIEICIKISLFILNKKHHRVKKLFDNNGIGFEDVAIDAIAPLFIKSDSFDLTRIKHSILNWHKKILTESDAHFFIFKVITRRTDQTVNEILSEVDPLFGRLLKNILYKSKKLNYKKIYYSGIAYLVDSPPSNVQGGIISEVQFNKIPINFSHNDFNLDLPSIFDYIKKNTNYYPAIPINNLVVRVKSFYTNVELIELDKSNAQSALEIKSALEKSLSFICTKIDKKYIQNNSITPEEGESLKKALNEISWDIMDGGIQRGLEQYLIPYFENLNKDDLRKKYRNILDYLVRLLKKEIYKEFNNKFPN